MTLAFGRKSRRTWTATPPSKDAALWYFEAIRAYDKATGDDSLVRDLFPILLEILDWHIRGTRYGIRLDPNDGLLLAGEHGMQLTWIDARVSERVVTPRIGKPVEVNALWYNALRSMAAFARRIGKSGAAHVELADRARDGFRRFRNDPAGYCFDGFVSHKAILLLPIR